jgi:hypothetical protein
VLQIAEHTLRQQADRFAVIGPFQLLLAGPQMVEQVSQPQNVGMPLAHGYTPQSCPLFRRVVVTWLCKGRAASGQFLAEWVSR